RVLDEQTGEFEFELISRTATGTRSIQLGTGTPREDTPILWTNNHTDDERFFLCQGSDTAGRFGDDLGDETQDLALIAVEVPLNFVVRDVYKFDQLATPEMRSKMIEVMGRRAATRHFAHMGVDEVLGRDRSKLQQILVERLAGTYDELPLGEGTESDAGIEVLDVPVSGVHPPKDAAPSFERVVQAETNRERKLEAARRDEAETLAAVAGSVQAAREIVAALESLESLDGADPETVLAREQEIEALITEAQGTAAATLAQARAARSEKRMQAWTDLVAYDGLRGTFEAAPDIFKARQYLSALGHVLTSARVVIAPSNVDLVTQVDLTPLNTEFDLFNQEDQ
ncbi:MAG: SPFH domain-containing protein, partial [Planctomycetota bacterium]